MSNVEILALQNIKSLLAERSTDARRRSNSHKEVIDSIQDEKEKEQPRIEHSYAVGESNGLSIAVTFLESFIDAVKKDAK